MSRAALLVPFPEVAAAVAPWLEHSVGARPSHGVPPHVTLLFPFPPPDDEVVLATRQLLDAVDAFDVEFTELLRFESSKALYLAPEPSRPFVRATGSLWNRFPAWPPYGGEVPDSTPHLTVAWGALLDEAEADLRPRLPLRARAREALLLTELEPTRWVVHTSFPLAGA